MDGKGRIGLHTVTGLGRLNERIVIQDNKAVGAIEWERTILTAASHYEECAMRVICIHVH